MRLKHKAWCTGINNDGAPSNGSRQRAFWQFSSLGWPGPGSWWWSVFSQLRIRHRKCEPRVCDELWMAGGRQQQTTADNSSDNTRQGFYHHQIWPPGGDIMMWWWQGCNHCTMIRFTPVIAPRKMEYWFRFGIEIMIQIAGGRRTGVRTGH